MGRKKRGYQSTTFSCGYKSIKIIDINLLNRFDDLCKRENSSWETMTTKAINEYLQKHENDDLKYLSREKLEEMVRQYRNNR